MVALLVACTGSRVRADGGPVLDRVHALRTEGKLDEALELLRAESRDVKRVAGEDSLRLLPINDLAAEILIDQGSLDAAESLLSKVITTREGLVQSGRTAFEAELAASLVTLARLQLQAKRYADAASSALRALRIRDLTAGPNSEEAGAARASLESVLDSAETFLGRSDQTVLQARDTAATAYEELGLFTAAVNQRRKIVAAIENPPGQKSPERLAAVTRLGRLMMLAGRAEEAIPIVEQALRSEADAPPATSLEDLRLLGELHMAAGQFIVADAFFRDAAEVIGATKGVSPAAANRDRLHRLLTDVRRESVSSTPDWFGAEIKRLAAASATDRDAAAAIPVAATILVALGTPGAAAEPLARGVTIARSTKPPQAATAADLSGRLADALIADGKHAAAVDIATKALAEAEPKLGPGDARVAFLRIMLADAQRRLGRGQATASEMIGEALARELPRPDDAWEERVIEVVDALADSAPDQGFRERFVEARARQFGDQHRHVGIAWSLFGVMRMAAGAWAEAETLLTKSLTVLRAGLGDDHPEIAAGRVLLARARLESGQSATAAAEAAEALAAWERLTGPEHPGTLAALDVLVAARLRNNDLAEVEPLLQRLCASGSSFSPIRQADHLVRLAMILLPSDPPRAEACLGRATELSCWDSDAAVQPRDLALLALTAARAAYVYKQLGQPDRSAETLQLARSWATRSVNAKAILEHVERLAESGRLATDA